MSRQEVFARFVAIVKPFSRKDEAAMEITDETILLDDLMINSARMVDIVLETEEAFGISIDDDSMSALQTVGDAVDLVLLKVSNELALRSSSSAD